MTLPKLTDDQEREITRLYAETDTPLSYIAQRFSIGEAWVPRIAQRHGAAARGRKRREQLTLEPEPTVSRETPPLHTGPIEHQDLIRVALDWIDPSPLNPRQNFDAAGLDELAQSMGADGQLQPIVLRPIDVAGDVRFSIVAGERRYRAAQQLGWHTIAAVVRPDLDERAHVRLALLENLARTDLNPLEEARGYQQLVDLGMTQDQVADAVHRSRPAIANALRLLKAPEVVQQKLRDGALQPSHVLPLLRYQAFPEIVAKLAEVAAERRTPSKELEKGFADLGYEFQNAATNAKLAVAVPSYGVEFDVAEHCEKCPFNAFQPGRYTGFCLKPEHFRQLQKEARAAAKAEADAAIAQASATGETVLKLSSLKYGQFERLDHHYGRIPKGCSAKCECRAAALDGANRAVKVCTNPTRFRKLNDEQRRQDQADKEARMKDLSDRCGEVLNGVDQVRSRELALLAADALSSGLDEKLFKAILTKHGVQLKSRRSDAIDFESLAHVEPLTLLKVAVEALLAADISRMSYQAEARFAGWYAGPPPPKAQKAAKASRKGKPKPEQNFDPDARLADEIAADFVRLEAEAEAQLNPEVAMSAVGAELVELVGAVR